MPLHAAVRLLLPGLDGVEGGLEQGVGQLGSIAVVIFVEIGFEILVDALLREALAEGGHRAGDEDAVVVHDAEEVIGELDVERLVEGAFHEGLRQVGLAAEADEELVELLGVGGGDVVLKLMAEAEEPGLEGVLVVVGAAIADLVAFGKQQLVVHKKAEELIDAVVVLEFGAVVVEDGGDDGWDELAVEANLVKEFTVAFDVRSDGMGLEGVEGLVEVLGDGALARIGREREAGDGVRLELALHVGPFLGAELVPEHVVEHDHLLQGGAVEAGVGFLEQVAQLVDGFDEARWHQGVVAEQALASLQQILGGEEVGLEERLGGKQHLVVLDELDVAPHNEVDLFDLDQEAVVAGLTAFIGCEKTSALFEIVYQELELVLEGYCVVVVHH